MIQFRVIRAKATVSKLTVTGAVMNSSGASLFVSAIWKASSGSGWRAHRTISRISIRNTENNQKERSAIGLMNNADQYQRDGEKSCRYGKLAAYQAQKHGSNNAEMLVEPDVNTIVRRQRPERDIQEK